jgi:hypothetical protein
MTVRVKRKVQVHEAFNKDNNRGKVEEQGLWTAGSGVGVEF